MKKKKAANATVETDELKVWYNQLRAHSENEEDCTDILQKIINYSFEHAISETELRSRLA